MRRDQDRSLRLLVRKPANEVDLERSITSSAGIEVISGIFAVQSEAISATASLGSNDLRSDVVLPQHHASIVEEAICRQYINQISVSRSIMLEQVNTFLLRFAK